jgi:hypothetical protein
MLDGDHKALVDAVLSVCARYGLGGTYPVDVLKEPLNHPVVWMEFGPVIALADAVALKMGALHDRALPRDVLDAHGAAAYFTRAELIAACRAALDEDFTGPFSVAGRRSARIPDSSSTTGLAACPTT